MNTPRTKPPTRYKYKPSKHEQPDGAYTTGVYNSEFTNILGDIVTYWPHVEERMIQIFGELLGIANPLLQRQTFRSLVNQNLRIKLMRAVLEDSPVHLKTDVFYDEIIAEFESLNKSRNTYAHSLWSTRDEDKRVFIDDRLTSPFGFQDAREVTMNELSQVRKRMGALVQKILKHELQQRRQQREGNDRSVE